MCCYGECTLLDDETSDVYLSTELRKNFGNQTSLSTISSAKLFQNRSDFNGVIGC